MISSGLTFSLSRFLYCAKACFANGLDHIFYVCFCFLKIDHCLLLFEAHLSLLHSVEPLQGSPHDGRASPSRHSLNPEGHCFEADWFTRADLGSTR